MGVLNVILKVSGENIISSSAVISKSLYQMISSPGLSAYWSHPNGTAGALELSSGIIIPLVCYWTAPGLSKMGYRRKAKHCAMKSKTRASIKKAKRTYTISGVFRVKNMTRDKQIQA